MFECVFIYIYRLFIIHDKKLSNNEQNKPLTSFETSTSILFLSGTGIVGTLAQILILLIDFDRLISPIAIHPNTFRNTKCIHSQLRNCLTTGL